MQESLLRLEKGMMDLSDGKGTMKQNGDVISAALNAPRSRFHSDSYHSQDPKQSPGSDSDILSPNEIPQRSYPVGPPPGSFSPPTEAEQKPRVDKSQVRQDWYSGWDLASDDILPDQPKGVETLPERHSTQAHRLLIEWRSLAPFFDASTMQEDYPADIEMNRGTLQLYGRGEGLGVADSEFQEYVATVGSPAGSSHSDDQPSHTSSPPQDLLAISKAPLDAQTCNRLLQSYLDNMYPMQPFLVKHRIKRLVDKFVRRVNPTLPPHFSPHPAHRFVSDTAAGESPGHRAMKRKRGEEGVEMVNGTEQQRRPDRNITSAIVLLVLALGEICQHKQPLPALPKDSRHSADAVPRSNYNHSPATPMSASSPLQHEAKFGQHRSPGGSADRSQTSEPKRNIDVYPGLRYYAMASEILGGVMAGTDILHAQGFLLAALYLGQLGRVNESWTWVWNAGRVCRLLVRRYVTDEILRLRSRRTNLISLLGIKPCCSPKPWKQRPAILPIT